MTKKLLTTLALGLAVTLPSAYATILAPGTPALPPDLLTVNGTQLATTSGSIVFPGAPAPPADFSATYTASVYSDPTNTFCPGCLDFVYQVADTSNTTGLTPGVIGRITASDFGSFSTDVGYQSGTGVAPTTVDRSGVLPGPGPVIGWNFPGLFEINPGQSSAVLIIQTDAHYFTSGTISAQNGTSGNGIAFEPTLVPEPVSMGFLGGGLALLGLARWRRGTKKG